MISDQYAENRQFVPASDGAPGWEWTSRGNGSLMIAELQRRLGVTDDGILGPATVRALQERLGVEADGYWGEATTRALQEKLNRGEGI